MSKLSGKIVSELHLQAISRIIQKRQQKNDSSPELAFFLVGDRVDSRLYVDIKKKMCDRVGIHYREHVLPENVSCQQLAEKIQVCNKDGAVDGIIIQLPLPDHLPEESLLQMVDPDKDVDGFHSINIARLVSRPVMDSSEISEIFEDRHEGRGEGDCDGTDNNVSLEVAKECNDENKIQCIQKSIINTSRTERGFYPCTPKGIVTLLDYYCVSQQSKKAVIVGCGRVGRPLGLMLLARGMTVSYLDRHSRKIDKIKGVREADVLIVAVGIRGIIDSNWIGSDTVVVDVGIHQTESGKTVGDLVLKDLLENTKTGRVTGVRRTPVPGGVGPMTVSMLLENTLISWIRTLEKNKQSSNNQQTTLNLS